MGIVSAASIAVLRKLLQLGIDSYKAWTTPGVDMQEIAALRSLLDLVPGGLGGKTADAPAQHLAIITQCFGMAFGRHWAYNTVLAAPRSGPFKSKDEKARAKELDIIKRA